MNTQQYLQMRKEAFRNDGVTATTANARDLLAWDTTRYTDWKKYIIGGTAYITNAQLTFSGGTELIRFLASADYYKQTTVFPGDFGNERSTVNFSLVNNSPDKKFNSQVSVGFGRDKSNLPQRDLTSLITIAPNTPELKDSLGRLLFTKNGFGFTNPLAVAQQSYDVTTERLTANVLLNYKILSQLVIKASLGYNLNRSSELSKLTIASQNPILNPKGSSSFGNYEVRTWIVEPQLEYNSNFSTVAKMQFVIGSSFQQNESNYSVIRGEGYTNDNLLNSTVGAASTTSQVGNSEYRYQALYSRLGFELYKRYLLNLTARRDGSSRFGPGKQFANFGAIGAGWIFSEEKVLKPSKLLSFGKLRGSYGITGNQPMADYQYLDTWGGITYPYQGQAGLQPSRIFNADYSWEQIRKLELSLDLGFIKDKLFFSSTWFKNTTTNQLISYTLPVQTGFGSVIKNFPGVVQNVGYEFSLTSKNLTRPNFSWSTSINLTISKNKLVSFPGLASSSYATSYEIGRPLNNFRGYHYLGINPQTGIYQFEDINKDNAINTLDYIYAGTTNPEWYGGITNSFRYKNFTLYFLVQFVKQLGMEPVYASFVASGTMLNNRPALVLDRWQQPGDDTRYQKFSQNFGGPAVNPATNNIGRSDAVLVNASYARLRNLSVEWNLPKNTMQKMRGMFILYVQGQNLLTFTSYSGPDPEVQAVNSLPPLRIITTGIKFNF
jgi:TonB-linked SusC/RagA family outer membrane protein